jgi:F0F1-type ATP synthase assembly protein I
MNTYKNDELKQLEKKIKHYKEQQSAPIYTASSNISASRVCIELISSVIAGIIIGALLDYLMKTKLIFKIICLLLSCVAGFYSIYKLSKQK